MNALLSTAEAAAALNLKPQTLRRWRIKGVGIPYVRVAANRACYRPQDIETFAKENLFRSTTEESTRAAARGK